MGDVITKIGDGLWNAVLMAWEVEGGRRRRVYRLTTSGRRAVKASQRDWAVFSTAVGRVLGGTA